MADLLRRLQGLVRIAKIKLIDDTGDQQVAQAHLSVKGPAGVEEVIDKVPRLGEYGFWSCPPEGSEAVLLFLAGHRSNGVIIATGARATRPKGLAPGEAMFGNPGGTGLAGGAVIKATKDAKLQSQAVDWTHAGDIHQTGTLFATHVKPADGWTGTFATGDGRTVHVTNGIIINVA